MKLTKAGMVIMTIIMSIVFVACSDDNNDETQGGTVNIGIPSTVVDNVRTSEAAGLKIKYNEDGTISTAETADGTEFKFNYAAVRSNTRPLTSITATTKSSVETSSLKADQFLLTPDGLIAGYKLEYDNTNQYWWEKGSITYTLTYDSNKRISKINMTGTWQDEEGTFPGSAVFSYSYGANGELLEIAGKGNNGENFSQKYEYGQVLNNKYNIMLSTLMPEDLISDDTVFAILGLSGYFGKTSALLPTKATLKYSDPEDPDYDETEIWNIGYDISANGAISWYSVNDIQYPCTFAGIDEDTEIGIK